MPRLRAVADRFGAPLSFLCVLALWETSCRLRWVSPVLLSAPSRIVASLASLMGSGALTGDLAATASALLLSLAIALAAGGALGVGMGLSQPTFRLIHPYLVSLNAIPKVALMPVLVLWFGLGLPPKVFLGAFMGSFPIAMAAYGGVRSLESDLLMMARSFGAGRMMILREVVLPGLLPHVLPALRVAANYALVGVLIVEFFAADRGLGYRIIVYSSNFQTEAFFALLLLVAAMGLACASTVGFLERRLVRWPGEERA
ncbi:MAG: ABC transporter permease [Elusimicrobia bacterium]|nr:ABC transporter permease [Elusimicrobiota bacterium]